MASVAAIPLIPLSLNVSIIAVTMASGLKATVTAKACSRQMMATMNTSGSITLTSDMASAQTPAQRYVIVQTVNVNRGVLVGFQ